MTGPIVESGMSFGPFPEGHCFYVEKSSTYAKVTDGVPTAEFLLLRVRAGRPSEVWVVEAKSGAPHPTNRESFEKFIGDIRDKLLYSFCLGLAVRLGRHPDTQDELPEPFRVLDLRATDVRLVLVIHGFEEQWLPPLQEALARSLIPMRKTWSLGPSVAVVLNDAGARRYGLIDLPTPV